MKTVLKISLKAFMAATILIGFSSLQAQETAASTGSSKSIFGIKGGANLSNLYVDEISDENAKLGFQLGFFAKGAITENFAIQPELIYSQKGAQLEYDNVFASGKTAIKLHYVELPVMAVFNFGKLNIHAGPYIAYLAGVSVKNKSDNGSNDFEEAIDKDNFESFDYGLAGGFGVDGDGVGFGIRYNYGLKEIGKERTFFGQSYRFPGAKNSVLQAYLTFGF